MFELLHYINPETFFSNNFENSNDHYVIKLNPKDLVEKRYSPLFFSKQYNFKFSFHIESSDITVSNEFWEALFLLFLHPRYLKTIFKPVIFCDNKNSSFISELTRLLARQRLFPLVIQVSSLNGNIPLATSKSVALSFNGNFNDLSQTVARIPNAAYLNNFFILMEEGESTDRRDLMTIEGLARGMLLQPFWLLDLIHRHTILINNKNEQAIILKEQLSNANDFLQYYRMNDNSKEINDFYYYEYEILPLWYKRLGHIIKVIMGKRTLRSLWNDNVKKYID